MEKKHFILLGESNEPIAVISADSPQSLRDKSLEAITDKYDGFTPRLKNSFDFTQVFDSWKSSDLSVEVHDWPEIEGEVSFYTDLLSIQQCVAY